MVDADLVGDGLDEVQAVAAERIGLFARFPCSEVGDGHLQVLIR
jgi:hypothetical protein